jgi:hypothetical protein
MDHLQSFIGWDYLTPQGIRFGLATVFALLVTTPGRSSTFEVFSGFLFNLVAGTLVAQAVSLSH